MTWLHPSLHDPALRETYEEVLGLAEWSDWVPLLDAASAAPREPGVYLLRDGESGIVQYAGMAGERAGSGRAQGLRGRLTACRSAQGAIGGFAEAALDGALADPGWVEAQLASLRSQGPRRTKEWAREAVVRMAPEVSWAVCTDRDDARHLETQVVLRLRPLGVWNG